MKFKREMRAVLQTVKEGFAFVDAAQTATEVENSIVVIQGQNAQKLFQFLKTVANLRWVGLVGLSVGLVQLIQYSLAFTVTRIKRMFFNIGFQSLGNIVHIGTSKKFW